MVAIIVLICVLCVVFVMSLAFVAKQADERAEAMIATPKRNGISDEVWELAKLMQVESPVNAPDWLCMLIGEVVMNRVGSWRYPDSIIDVIHDDKPVQFECVFQRGWYDIIPDDDFIDLAERLINGERAIGDSEMLFFGHVPEGTGTLVSYYDRTTKTITYFCKG